ncbi:hypothetical protein H2203_003030 [Taxawa tesnikishii (nom. ined.)]|nr:hypothetical protein H2203_003030 [Dothideales sp. JES 119]
MLGLRSFILLAVLATLALAAPTPQRNINKRSFSVPRVRRANYKRDPTAAMVKAYRKFGFTFNAALANATGGSTMHPDGAGHHNWHMGNHLPIVTPSTASSVSGDSAVVSTANKVDVQSLAATGSSGVIGSGKVTGEVSATPVDNAAEYISPVTIGGQQLNLDFDTGSSDLWVFSTKLSSSAISGHSAFNPDNSKTFKLLDGESFTISYGDNSGASGIVGTDTVTIGGATVTSQAVELATSVSAAFIQDTDSDGLVGLAFSSLNAVSPNQQKTFFDNIMSDLAQPVFTADLNEDSTGSYEFGVIDSSKYSGNLTFVPVDASSGFWKFESSSFTVGSTTVVNPNASPAIADTGTSLVLVDDEVATHYYKQIKGSKNDDSVGGWTYPCSADIPDFGVSIGGQYTAVIPGSSVTFAKVTSQTCFGGIQSNGGSNIQIYGDVMFRNTFVVFDGQNKVLGLAKKN